MILIIINGTSGSGKDTFIKKFEEYTKKSIVNYSSVQYIKDFLDAVYGKEFKYQENEKYRSVVHDINSIMTDAFDTPINLAYHNYFKVKVDNSLNLSDVDYFFIHMREIGNISDLKYLFNTTGAKAYTLYIHPHSETKLLDLECEELSKLENYNYDIYFDSKTETYENKFEEIERITNESN